MLESKAYKTYYTFAYGEKTPKPKYVRKKADPDTSPKQKIVQATKGTRIKTKSKVAKSDKKKQPVKMPKAKGLDVLSKVALTEAGYQKKQEILSQITCNDEEDDDEDDFEDDDDDDNNESDKERTESDRDEIPDPNTTNEEHDKEEEEYDDEFNIKEDEKMDEKENDKVIKELYKDVNVNLGNKDADMTDANQSGADQQNASQQLGFEQEEEDTHVTPVSDTQKTGGLTQSSSVSFDFTSKLLNLNNPCPADNEIASLMDTIAHHATYNTPCFQVTF
nr:hypothetical protein [Tanacetum cinerariifolium]